MAIAKAEITISRIVDIASVTRYYKLQSSTASAPAKPTTNPPSGWATAEPSYTSGSTNTLYFVDQTIFTNGTFSYSTVSISSSYEAAKEAYNKAQAAGDAASDANDKIDNLEVGGRNLLLKTDSPQTSVTGTGGSNQTNTIYYFSDYCMTNYINKLDDGKQFVATISFDWETTVTSGDFQIQYNGWPYSVFKAIVLSDTNTSGHVENTVTLHRSSNATTATGISCRLDDLTGFITFSNFKLEIGNKATDWTPAPEDVQQGIDDAQDTANNAQNTATNNTNTVNQVKSELQILSNSISTLVTDKNGGSLMTQTPDGWTFNIGNIQSALDKTVQDLNTMEGDVASVNGVIDNLQSLTNDLVAKTAYIIMTTDADGSPCLELGKEDNPFKVRITNTSIDFMEGSQKIAYITNHSLYIQSSVVTDELQIGESPGWVWKKRGNNNLGLRWKL